MNLNGLVIQKRNKGLYQGIEGDNWYLNYDCFNDLDDYFEKNIEKAWENSDYVDVCNDIKYIQKYICISQSKNINFRVLACVTEKKIPQMVLPDKMHISFLGYDYAYSGGSYYSAVLNDIVSKRISRFADIPINDFGLFETYKQVIDFINQREAIKKIECNEREYIEEGDFIIYKLYELKM